MSSYQIITEDIQEKDLSWGIDPFLFSEPSHLQLNPLGEGVYLYLVKEGVIEGIFSCHVENDQAHSPYFAPYSGFQIKPELSLTDAAFFIEGVENHLETLGVKQLRVKSFPEGTLWSESSSVNYLMMERGYRISHSELHAILPITNTFSTGVVADYQRRLKLSIDFDFGWEDLTTLKECYEFLINCREERGQAISMSMEKVYSHMKMFPDKFRMATLRERGNLVAISIFVSVNRSIIYDYTHSHLKKYDRFSPIIKLLNEAIKVFEEEGFSCLDLGSSSLETGPNFSLLDFKKKLGSQFYRKDLMIKDL